MDELGELHQCQECKEFHDKGHVFTGGDWQPFYCEVCFNKIFKIQDEELDGSQDAPSDEKNADS